VAFCQYDLLYSNIVFSNGCLQLYYMETSVTLFEEQFSVVGVHSTPIICYEFLGNILFPVCRVDMSGVYGW